MLRPSFIPLTLTLGFILASAQALASNLPDVRDIYGVTHNLSEYVGEETKAIVLVVLDPQCPVVQKTLPAVINHYHQQNNFERDRAGRPVGKSYQGDPVRFLGIYPKKDIGSKAMAAHAAKMRIPFQVVADPELQVLKYFGLTRLSETALLDPQWKKIYQGPVNDQYVQGAGKNKASQDYLSLAFKRYFEGPSAAPTITKMPAVGCLVDLDRSEQKFNDLTYSKDIAPIVRERCQKCHEDGAVAPFALQSYQDVVDWAGMIEEVVVDERMPPWPAVSTREFHHTEQMTPEERLTFIRWLRSDQNIGEEKGKAPALNQYKADEWRIENPDFVFTMPKATDIPANGVMEYVYVPVPLNGGKGFDEDRWIEAIETRPGDPAVVHHIQIHEYAGPVDKAPSAVEQIVMYGLSIENANLIGSFTPGNEEENNRDYRRYLPPGSNKTVGMKLNKGTNLMLEMHYTTNGTATKDQSSVAIRFAKKKPDLELHSWFPFRKRADMIIPANVQNHSLQDFYHFGQKTNGKAVLIHGTRPHLHTRGKNYRLELIDAAGFDMKDLEDFSKHGLIRGESVLELPVWDFNWQHLYRFKEPILVTPDKALLATAYWDNTAQNPRNPDNNVDAEWGQQTEQEMFNSLFIYEVLEPNDPRLKKAGK